MVIISTSFYLSKSMFVLIEVSKSFLLSHIYWKYESVERRGGFYPILLRKERDTCVEREWQKVWHAGKAIK